MSSDGDLSGGGGGGDKKDSLTRCIQSFESDRVQYNKLYSHGHMPRIQLKSIVVGDVAKRDRKSVV